MTSDLLSGLNIKQFEAVTTRSNATLVLAGAGSGKTGVLTRRIAYLIAERGVSPQNVLALTFTRKAANEMKERLAKLLDERTAKKIWVGTFHSISLRILHEFGSKLGYSSNISVYDEIDQLDVITAIVNEFGMKDVAPKHVIEKLHGYASDCDGTVFDEPFATIIQEYRNRLKSYNAVDFSLLLTETLELFRAFPDVYEFYHNRFQYVFVDEYQDVDRTQYYLHEALKPNNIFVVGDHDQSIYKFRGSDIQIVLDFEKTHPGAEIIKLEQSYRCPSDVIEMANKLIGNNEQRIEKILWTENGPGKVLYDGRETWEQEAELLANQIIFLTKHFEQPFKPGDIAVLARTHAYLKPIAMQLQAADIPFKMVGDGINFWKSTGPRILIAILKVLHNPKDSWNFERLAKTVLYDLSDVEWLQCETEALQRGTRSITVVLEKHSGKFKELLDWYIEQGAYGYHSLKHTIEKVLELFPITTYLSERSLFSKADIMEHLPENLDEWFLQNTEDQSVDAFLGWLAEQDIQSEADESDTVKLATIHAVKGLEFPVVFMAGMAEQILPHKRSIKDNDVEEERRLCYVGITRVMKRLYLSNAHSLPAGIKVIQCEPSRFLEEMGVKSK